MDADQLSRPFPAAQSEQELIEPLRIGRAGGEGDRLQTTGDLRQQGGGAGIGEAAGRRGLRSWSRIALEAIPDPAADAALVEAAKTLQGQLLVGTINSIGVRRSAGAVDQLAERLKDSDAQVASAAAVALGRIGSDAATNILRQSLASASTCSAFGHC